MRDGYVYVLKTESFRAIKIGSTTKTPDERAEQLSGTSLPHPFEVVYSVYSLDCKRLERQVHQHFKKKRKAYNREFFLVSVEEAIKVIDMYIDKNAVELAVSLLKAYHAINRLLDPEYPHSQLDDSQLDFNQIVQCRKKE